MASLTEALIYEYPANDIITFTLHNFTPIFKIIADRIHIPRYSHNPHAKIALYSGSFLLAVSECNVDRDEERVRLINSAFAKVKGQELIEASLPSKGEAKHILDLFCIGLWDAYLRNIEVEIMEGNEEDILPAFLLKPFILEGGGTFLYGPPGRGKSWTCLLIAISIDAHRQSLWPTEKTATLYINLERSRQSFKQRLRRANLALELEPTRPLAFLNKRGYSLQDIYQHLVAFRNNNPDYNFGILDSVSRAGMGDLNENQPANNIVDQLNKLFPTWLAAGHTPKASDNQLFGSQMFGAGGDVMIKLLTSRGKDPTRLGVGLLITKANDIPPQEIQIYEYSFDDGGLIGVKKATAREYPEIAAGQEMPKADQIDEYLRLIGKSDATTIAEELKLDRADVSRILSNDPRFLKLGRDGHKVIYGVISTREER